MLINMSECHAESCHPAGLKRFDVMLYGTMTVLVLAAIIHMFSISIPYLASFSQAVVEIIGTVWWGLLFGLIVVGLMNKVPREYFNAMLGRGDTFSGLCRAALAGLFLDLCSHGILMVGAKLYERGASLAQVMTFLIASPWNSLSLTLILMALVGVPWTLVFIVGSVLIALVTGCLYMMLVRYHILPGNPHEVKDITDFSIKDDLRERLKSFKLKPVFFKNIVFDGWHEGKMVMRWLFLGIIIAALIRAFVSTDVMVTYFGATMMGLLLTLLATTVIEVCSEGSTPVGAELVTRAGAPGNGFTFLMAGVATDYTEMMVIKQFTKRWLISLSLPLLTVPQILLLGWIMNHFGAS